MKLNSTVVKIQLHRQLNNKMLKTLLPTVLINMVCIAANYYTYDIFDVIVMINLTGLLVMATIFNDSS